MPSNLHHHCECSYLSPQSGQELFQDKDNVSAFLFLSGLPERQEKGTCLDHMVLIKKGDATNPRNSPIMHIK